LKEIKKNKFSLLIFQIIQKLPKKKNEKQKKKKKNSSGNGIQIIKNLAFNKMTIVLGL